MTLSNTIYGLEAIGTIKSSTGVLTSSSRGCAIARIALGQYRVTMERTIGLTPGAAAEGAIAFGMVTAGRTVAVSIVSPTAFDILTSSVASGASPAVIGSIDGTTVPGTPTFTGTGVSAIVQNAAGIGCYDLTLTSALQLEPGAGCTGVIELSPTMLAPGSIFPDAARATDFYVAVTDTTHITIFGYGTSPTRKDWQAGLVIWPIAGSGGGGAAAADSDLMFNVTRFSP